MQNWLAVIHCILRNLGMPYISTPALLLIVLTRAIRATFRANRAATSQSVQSSSNECLAKYASKVVSMPRALAAEFATSSLV